MADAERAAASRPGSSHGASFLTRIRAGMQSARGAAGDRDREWWVALALTLLTILCYLPATRAGFVWDDVIITTLPAVQDWGGLWRLWFDPGNAYQHGSVGEGHYWPLTYSSFWLEHKLWGFSPLGYHLVNLLLHLANTLLLWRLLLRLAAPAPWLVAALFAVHPLHVESVVWVIGRKDLLSALCYFTAVMAWLRFTETRQAGRYLLALAWYAAGLLCKSSIVTLPAALLLLHWWKEGRVSLRTFLETIPFFLVGLVITLADLSFYQGREAFSLDHSMTERVLLAAQALWFYPWKLFWPTGLAVVYPHWEVSAANPLAWACLVATLAVALLFWFGRHRLGRGALAAVGFFALTLAPTLGFIDYGYMQFSYVADRYQYLAGIGIMALFAGAAVTCLARLPGRARTVVAGGALPVLLLLPGALTWKQAGMYRDEVTFFNHIIALNPDARRVYQNLAAALNREGRAEEALAAARHAVEKDPGVAEVITTLGAALLELERYEEAEQQFRRALALKPRYAEAWQNLADLLRRREQYEASLEAFRKALETRPDNALVHAGMGYSLFRLHRYEEAVTSIKRALSLQPGLVETHNDLYLILGQALQSTGRTAEAERYLSRVMDEQAQSAADFLLLADTLRVQEQYRQAVENYRQALEQDPDQALAYAGLGDALFRLQRYQEALESMQQALALQPEQPSAAELHYLTGESLHALGRSQQAPEQYRAALRINPQFDEAARRLAELLFAQERFAEALALYQALAGRNPDDVGTRTNLGAVLFMLGRAEEALQQLDLALSLDPTDEIARANREQVWMSMQE